MGIKLAREQPHQSTKESYSYKRIEMRKVVYELHAPKTDYSVSVISFCFYVYKPHAYMPIKFVFGSA